ncbi:MAG: hypothetical protein ABI824_06800 [Acidobacteriota bacterium]
MKLRMGDATSKGYVTDGEQLFSEIVIVLKTGLLPQYVFVEITLLVQMAPVFGTNMATVAEAGIGLEHLLRG